MTSPVRVLFLCTGNSARSQMAEALLRRYGGADFEVRSAGTDPQGVHPLTLRVLEECGVATDGLRSEPLEQYTGEDFDYIITVCDRARDNCPTFPGDAERIHWGFEDPAAASGDEAARLAVFRRVHTEIASRIRTWAETARKDRR